MPVASFELSLCVIGSVLAGSSVYFYRARQTLPFKVCASLARAVRFRTKRIGQRGKESLPVQVSYFLAWPILGSGIILLAQPPTAHKVWNVCIIM
jgi:hypothetical protein